MIVCAGAVHAQARNKPPKHTTVSFVRIITITEF
jgi:hypothetical protein